MTTTCRGLPPRCTSRSAESTARPRGCGRVDATHANAFGEWQKLGSPAQPSAAQVAQLKTASRLVAETVAVTPGGIDVTIPRQGVVLVELQP
ncbi:beta-xylosidase [Sphingomonas sp. PvP055]